MNALEASPSSKCRGHSGFGGGQNYFLELELRLSWDLIMMPIKILDALCMEKIRVS